MRKLISFMLLTVLLVTLWLCASAETRYVVSENGATVNMRSGPGMGYSVVTRIKSGSEVEYVETEDGWCLVRYKGKSGYVDGSFVVDSVAAEEPKATNAPKSTQVPTLAYITSPNGKPANLRSGPGTGYDQVGTAEVGKAVTVYERGSSWSQISVDGEMCYVLTRLLSSTKPDITSAPEETPQPSYTAYIVSSNGGPVRIRKGPGTSYGIAGEISYGMQVTVDGKDGSWNHVQTDTVTGYVMSKYLSATKPDTQTAGPESTVKPAGTKAYVVSANGKSVNVRKSDRSSAKVVTSLEYGTEVMVEENGGKWSKITGSFGEGYILNTYLTSTDPGPYATAEPAFKSYTAYVYSSNGKSVNLRKGAGSRYGTVASLDVGTEVSVIGENGSWKHVTTGGLTGFIMQTFLSDTKPATPEDQTVSPSWIPGNGTRVYLASGKNKVVRTYSAMEGKKADGKAYPAGTPAKVVSTENGWAEISVGSSTCYLPISSLASTGAAAIPNSANRLIYYLKGTSGNVNVRRSYQPTSDSLGSFLNGTAVIVMARNTEQNWAYIEVGSTKGYVDISDLASRP